VAVMAAYGSGAMRHIVVVAGAAMFGLGLVDDLRRLKPSTKLIVQIVVACLVIFAHLRLDWTGIGALDDVLTILWIIVVTNPFNLIDNMDGLCAGVAAITAAALGASAPEPFATVY